MFSAVASVSTSFVVLLKLSFLVVASGVDVYVCCVFCDGDDDAARLF